MVEVWTARISTRDPDAFNVTRKSGDPIFAPSWPLLRSALDIRKAGREQTQEEWRAYAQRYAVEMQASRVAHRAAWGALLARQRVVLTCYCTNPLRCHRRVLGLLLGHLGADFRGELPAPDAVERELFQLAMEMGSQDDD